MFWLARQPWHSSVQPGRRSSQRLALAPLPPPPPCCQCVRYGVEALRLQSQTAARALVVMAAPASKGWDGCVSSRTGCDLRVALVAASCVSAGHLPGHLPAGGVTANHLPCRKRHASMPISARAFLQCYCEASPERDTRVISHDRRVGKISPAPLSGPAGFFLQPWVSVADGSSPVRNSRSSPPLSVHCRRVISCGELLMCGNELMVMRTDERCRELAVCKL